MNRTTTRNMFSVLFATLMLVKNFAQAQQQQVQRAVGDRVMMAGSFCPLGSWPAEGQWYDYDVNDNAELFQKFYDPSEHRRNGFYLPDLRGGPLTQCIVFSRDFEGQRYLGEVYESEGTCPLGSVATDGKSLSIGEALNLYGLIGASYGGDGVSNFKLPSLNNLDPFYCISINGLYPKKNSQSRPISS
ncbi:tail fiber protein [Glaciecola siphonariae]|uniref:Tail fiber protein n=1 Tax=Glaciecola siphonariae TaxID=521012 RepID=A0ABV9LRP2_9ALTE